VVQDSRCRENTRANRTLSAASGTISGAKQVCRQSGNWTPCHAQHRQTFSSGKTSRRDWISNHKHEAARIVFWRQDKWIKRKIRRRKLHHTRSRFIRLPCGAYPAPYKTRTHHHRSKLRRRKWLSRGDGRAQACAQKMEHRHHCALVPAADTQTESSFADAYFTWRRCKARHKPVGFLQSGISYRRTADTWAGSRRAPLWQRHVHHESSVADGRRNGARCLLSDSAQQQRRKLSFTKNNLNHQKSVLFQERLSDILKPIIKSMKSFYIRALCLCSEIQTQIIFL